MPIQGARDILRVADDLRLPTDLAIPIDDADAVSLTDTSNPA